MLDARRMSLDTGIGIVSLWIEFDLKPDPQTLEEAKSAWSCFPKDSPHKQAIYEAWQKFAMEKVDGTNNIKALCNIFENDCPPKSPERSHALGKISKQFLEQIENVSDSESADRLLDSLPSHLYPHLSEEKKRLLEKWTVLSEQAIAAGSSSKKMRIAYQYAPPSLREKALEKWLTFVTDAREAKLETGSWLGSWRLYDPIAYRGYSECKKRWREFLAKQMAEAKTLEDLYEVFRCEFYKVDALGTQAFEKALSLCTTTDELDEVLSRGQYCKYSGNVLNLWVDLCARPADILSAAKRFGTQILSENHILLRWKMLSAKQIAVASTFEEVVTAFDEAPPQTLEKANALKKMLSLARLENMDGLTEKIAPTIHDNFFEDICSLWERLSRERMEEA